LTCGRLRGGKVPTDVMLVGGEGFALFPCLLKEICAIQFGTNAHYNLFGLNESIRQEDSRLPQNLHLIAWA